MIESDVITVVDGHCQPVEPLLPLSLKETEWQVIGVLVPVQRSPEEPGHGECPKCRENQIRVRNEVISGFKVFLEALPRRQRIRPSELDLILRVPETLN